MTDQLHDQNDLSSEIFGNSGEYKHQEAKPKKFRPWHRPRKQFVRREQWAALLLRLYEKRDPGEPLRYLGLPGTDLIDLRYLYEQLCQDNGRGLCFLGFVTEAKPGNSAEAQLNISLDEVRHLKNVDKRSRVLSDDFRRISDPTSIAWDRTQQLGPFDVVNIDLCDGLASGSPQNNESVYNALKRLLLFQSLNHNPWLLLITTRINRGAFDEEAKERLINLFKKNVDTCEGFAEMCEQYLKLDARSIDPASCSEADLLNLMIVAICKWLTSLIQPRESHRIELASTYGYQVYPGAAQEDLVSLALRIKPVSVDGLPPPSTSILEDECSTAKAFLERSTHRQNVDAILEQFPQVREQSIEETKQLLKQARYDPMAYCEWLESDNR